jgi:hypothetical protein
MYGGDNPMKSPQSNEGIDAPSDDAMDAPNVDGLLTAADIAPLQVDETRVGKLIPRAPSPRPRRPNLQTLPDVRREMARVYREMRHGRIEAQDGTRLTYVLTQIAKIIQTTELDARIDAVERALKMRSP